MSLQRLVGVPKAIELQRMPLGGSHVTDAELPKIADWIRQGAPNN